MARHDEAPDMDHEAEDTGRAPAARREGSPDPAEDGGCADARRLMRHGLFGR